MTQILYCSDCDEDKEHLHIERNVFICSTCGQERRTVKHYSKPLHKIYKKRAKKTT